MNRHGEYKRRHQRKNVNVLAWSLLSLDAGPHVTETIDLASEGARLTSAHPVESYSIVLLRLRLEDSTTTIECKGRICWCESVDSGVYHYGVRFLDLSDDERELLEKYLAKHNGSTAPNSTNKCC